MIIPVVYFSSSNNTDYIAKIIAKGIDSADMTADLIRVENAATRQADLAGAEIIGVGSPIYAGEYVSLIRDWTAKQDFTGKKVFLFSTASEVFLTATADMKRMVEKNHGKVIGVYEIKMPGAMDGVWYSMTAARLFPLKRTDLETALSYGMTIRYIIVTGSGYADFAGRHRLGALVRPLVIASVEAFLSCLKRAIFRTNADKCTGCDKCAKDCPTGAMSVNDLRPARANDKCIACFRCFKECPTQALCLRLAGGKEFYRGPWQLKGYVDPDELAAPESD